MKRILCLVLSVMLVLSLAACTDGPTVETEKFELALVTDLGTIDDKSFNQGSWEGLVKYAEENEISHKYYQPTEQSDDAYLTAIELAVTGGAKVIVTPGYLFETPIYIAQDRYPEVNFILIDGVPHDADYADFKTGDNAVGILYAEDQAGFLAGYAAVLDGYRELGFMGGIAVPAVIRFGYGFVQGAEYAAKELELEEGDVNISYNYTGAFWPLPEIQAMSAAWYEGGTEVIFSCGGGICLSIFASAEAAGTKVIGVDVDQAAESDTVITSAVKGLGASVYSTLEKYYADSFPGGQTLVMEAANDGVGLPMGTSRFETFSQADYDAIFAKLVKGEIPRMVDDGKTVEPSVVPVELVTVNFVE